MKKMLTLFSIITLSISCSCSTNNSNSYIYNVYEKDERYLLADIPYNEVRINVSFSYEEMPSDELNEKYINELGLRKYKKYLEILPYCSYILTYKFPIDDFNERDKKFFENLKNSDLISNVSIYYFKEYGALAKINTEYYGFKDDNNIEYTTLEEIKIDAGIYSTKEMFENALENALIHKKIENNQMQTILNKFPNSFFDEKSLVVLGTSTSGSISDTHTLYDVYFKDNTIYGLIEIAYANSFLLLAIKEQTHCICISKDYLENINQIELLYCPYSRLELINK